MGPRRLYTYESSNGRYDHARTFRWCVEPQWSPLRKFRAAIGYCRAAANLWMYYGQGSAEMYNLLLKHFTDIVEDAICVGRRLPEDTDETVVLFLKIKKGKTFTPELAQRIKGKARSDLSQRHVIHVVDECPEIPVTANGKKVERAVKQILSGGGMHVKISASVANGHCLEWYRTWAKSH